ncbi:FAD-dependent oxidoreductase [Parahaliea aestuarii]|uniref:3-oxosteroid 1-dehydrogenase n=1 Tax=Parahaliea aestuarii TaxID=1852021 RepID=A0A5C8ZTI6_9GAMM|nr:FAD-dependent oxidoreductase [Parahaliea aestuarii]TXS91766.1 FAD-dependent oxidoreductase [Parahaliea aestuarii]
MWDAKYDVLVIGSGAGALTAACRARDRGQSVVVLEKAPRYGGTSASSGGGLWIPNNHLMLAAGIDDSDEDALTYLQALTGGDVDPTLVEAYVKEAPQMLRYLEEQTHVAFESMVHYADYYQNLAGSRPGGRSIDPLPYHARELGEAFHAMGLPHIQTRVMGLMGYTNQEGAVLLSKAPGWWKVVLKLAVEYALDIPGRLQGRRSRRLVMGNALVGRLRHSLDERGIGLELNAPVRELLVEQDRVCGVVVDGPQGQRRIHARHGVIIGAGGFEHSQAMRERYLPGPTRAEWSAASPTNTGDLLEAATAIGAATHLMDEAWWGPTIRVEGEDRARMLFTERSMPGCILVNRAGRRFVNESVAYTTAVQAMYKPDNLPCYAIFDSRYRREYPFGPLLPGAMHLDFLQSAGVRRDLLAKADSIAALAQQLGIDGACLEATVQRFNGYAGSGVDEEFHRGEDSYDLLYGDVRLGPNPCLAALGEAPFYGIEVYPGDIGTKGGLLTDASAQVLNADGEALGGLYAIGNSAASVMGRYYPGAGATLGPAMTFGFIAANHIADGASTP